MKQPQAQGEDSAPSGPVPTLLEAIVRRRCVVATYNRGPVVLAPHILYTRHDVLHVDAVTVMRDGKPPREQKIATYRLSGLSDIALSPETFAPNALFEPDAARYAGVALLAIERPTA